MCQKIVTTPHFWYANMLLETQRFSGKCDKHEGITVFKINGFKHLIFMLNRVQMQPTFGVEVKMNSLLASPAIRMWCSLALKDKNITCRKTSIHKIRMLKCFCVSCSFYIGVSSGARYSHQLCRHLTDSLLTLIFTASLSVSSGTNQWPRTGGPTPPSPNYENSLHSLVSSLFTSL